MTTADVEPLPESQATRPSGRLGGWHDGEAAHFRLWAPDHERIEVVLYRGDGSAEMASLPMEPEGGGRFRASIEGPRRLLYRYRVDGAGPFPDPASRAQPLGVHGPSQLADDSFAWTDGAWRGIGLEDLVVYELHVGAATREGTFDALRPRLPALRALGVTAIELMPVASFPGRRNWGYDGVSLFAPHARYGGPSGLRRLVDAAHRAGLAVLLDVVYNHLGPDGNYLRAFARGYFTDRHTTPWGEAIDLSRPEVREFFFQNSEMWIRDFHLDGLRLDATHAIFDDPSEREVGDPDREPFLGRLAVRARGAAAEGRRVLVIAEDDRNDRRLVLPPERGPGGLGLDAVWADDFHHQMRRALAGDADGYYRDYTGRVEDIVTTLRQGWFYQGQRSQHWRTMRGSEARGIDPPRFVHCLQNHDQIGNRALGDRLGQAIDAAAWRAASALLLLTPYTPLLFMGQEWNASTPFLYFTDHAEPLGRAVREGRRAEFASFTAFSGEAIPDPQAIETFERSVLRWDERERPGHRGVLALYRELLRLRAEHPALRGRGREHFDVLQLGEHALGLRRRSATDGELMLVVCLAGGLRYAAGPAVTLLLHTEEARFEGDPAAIDWRDGTLRIAGAGAALLESPSPRRSPPAGGASHL